MDKTYKIDNVVIDKIYSSAENKEGKAYVSSKGNPFKKVDIYIDPREVEDPKFDGKMTYFDYFDISTNWGVGSTISGTITTNEVGGRTYFNYNPPPTGKKAVELDIKELTSRVEQLEKQVIQIMKVKGLTGEVDNAMAMSEEMLKEEDTLDDEITDDDLPF